MAKVTLTGWETGFQKISMNRLLREHTGYSLAKAKAAVDDVLGKAPVTVEFETDVLAERFLSEARQLGAIGYRE